MASGAQPRAVLLDALGTLVGLQPPWPLLVRELRARHGIEISLEQSVAALRAEMAYYRAHCHRAHDAHSLALLRRRCAEIVAERLGEPVGALGIDALIETLLAALRFSPYPDARPALERLRARGAGVVVVSNWDVSLHDVLRETGLAPLLNATLTSAEFGCAKPAPEIFAAALALLSAGPADAVHVGDSLEEDVAGARAAGVEALLLVRAPGPLLGPSARPSTPARLCGVQTISSLAELAGAAA